MISVEPVDYALVVDTQQPTNRSEAQPFHAQLHGLRFQFWGVTHWLRIGSEVALARFAAHSLRAGLVAARFDYLLLPPTVKASLRFHALILSDALFFVTPRRGHRLPTPTNLMYNGRSTE